MAVKEEKIEVEGEVVESSPQHDVPDPGRRRARGARDNLREDAQELHSHPSGRPGEGGAVGIRPVPRPDHLPLQMKVRASVKPMCERCRVIKRHGTTMVICT